MISTAELRRAGITEADLRALKQHGVIVPMARGIYARASDVTSLAARPGGPTALRAVAAVPPFGPQTVISHGDAAVINGLDLIKRDSDKQGIVSLTRSSLAPGSRTTRPGV